MTDITVNLRTVLDRIAAAARECGRDPSEVMLLGVSKGQPVSAIEQAVRAGLRHFGENYLQDATAKIEALESLPLTWHFIGHLQSNKTRPAATAFDWVHTVDSARVARRLDAQRPGRAPPINVCLQVRIGDEDSKFGISPRDVQDLAEQVAPLAGLRLRGLMCIPPAATDPAIQRSHFRELREIFQGLCRSGFDLDTLSMGMSADLEAAIAEGATIVRVGTAIFGPRPATAAQVSG